MLFGLVLTALVSIQGLYRIQQQYDKMLSETYEMLLTSVTEQFSNALDETSNYILSISSDDALQSALSQVKDTDKRAALGIMQRSRSLLQRYLNSTVNPGLFAMGVCTDKGSFYNSTYYPNNGYDPELGNKFSDEEFQTFANTVPRDGQIWTTDYINYGLIVAQRIRRISPMKLDDLGVVIGCVDLEELMEECTAGSQYDDFIFSLYNENGDEFYRHSKEKTDSFFHQMYSTNGSYLILKSDSGTWFAVSGTIDKYNWNFVYAVPYDSVLNALNTQRFHVITTLVICVMISLLLGTILLHQMLMDLDKLMEMTEKVGQADFKSVSIAKEDRGRQDELGQLLCEFTAMSGQIDNLIHDNYQSKLLAQEAKLQALEMQINPHFLYNTLESVRCCAKMGMNDDICHIVESLGNMMHCIMKDDKEIQLRQELELVNDYLAIQNVRFDEKLSYYAEVDENCYDAVVPKLTILPLVENAVIHGVENSVDGCKIQLFVARNGDTVCIHVKNSGTQFPEDLLNHLRNREIAPTRNGIGLLNVDSRLGLFFEQKYTLSFYNEPSYAVVEMTFPYLTERKENRDAEISDC